MAIKSMNTVSWVQLVAWFSVGLLFSLVLGAVAYLRPPDGTAPIWLGVAVFSALSWACSLLSTILIFRSHEGEGS